MSFHRIMRAACFASVCLPRLTLHCVLQALEASLFADLLREEAEYLHSLEQQDLAMTVEDYQAGGGHTPWEHGSSGDCGAAAVACPLCQDGAALALHRGVILCARGHLRLDVAEQKLTLAGLRARLAAATERHAGAGCAAPPAFEQRGSLGCATLVMLCGVCGALEVIA